MRTPDIQLVTNLSPDRAAVLRAELLRLPPDRLSGPVTVLDRSVPGCESFDEGPVPCPAGNKPVEIEALWKWDCLRQSYRVLGDPRQPVILGGGAEGALYGFYRWLGDHGGCRWPCLDDEANAVGLPARRPPEAIVTPATAWRGFEGALKNWDLPFLASLMRWMLRNGWNLLLFNASQWRACPYRDATMELAQRHGIRLVIGGHAVDQFLAESLFESHPEFFGMRKGDRVHHAEATFPDMPGRVSRLPVQPCYGNPATRRFLAERIADFIDGTPGISAFSLWPHDGSNNWCECPACACDTPYRLMHQLARDILALTRHPVPIEILAYCNLLTPPQSELPPEPRLYTLFCPYLRHYRHRLDDPGFANDRQRLGRNWPAPQPVNPVDDREYGRLFEAWLPHWRNSHSGLGIFAYYQLAFVDHTCRSDRSRYLYLPDLDLLAHEIRLFRRSGMGTFYDCSWPLPGLWPDARYASVLSRLLWDPDADAGCLQDAYYADTLGAQAPAVQAVLRRISEALNQAGRPPLPPPLLAEAADVLHAVGGPAGERYCAWLDYVQLADQAWQARQAGSWDAVQAAERAIQELFARHRELLTPHLQVDWMVRTSRGYEKLAIVHDDTL